MTKCSREPTEGEVEADDHFVEQVGFLRSALGMFISVFLKQMGIRALALYLCWHDSRHLTKAAVVAMTIISVAVTWYLPFDTRCIFSDLPLNTTTNGITSPVKWRRSTLQG